MLRIFLFLLLYTAGYREETISLSTREFGGFSYVDIKPLSKLIDSQLNFLEKSRRLLWQKQGNVLVLINGSNWVLINGKPYNFPLSLKVTEDGVFLPISILDLLIKRGFNLETRFEGNHIKIYDRRIKIEKVVIDPGHGGKDPGAIGLKKTNEKDIVLEVAKIVTKELEKLGIECILTREKDVFIPLEERTRIANQKGANLFVSIHMNACNNRKTKGCEVYFLSNARTGWERAVEARENSVVKFEERPLGSDIESILWDLAQTEHLSESKDLSAYILKSIIKKTNAKSRGVKQANFYVLRGAYMPAVLVEGEFLSNPECEKRLNNKDFLRKIAMGIVDGVKQFKTNYEKWLNYE